VNSITVTAVLAVGVAAVPLFGGRSVVLWLGGLAAVLVVASVLTGNVRLLTLGAIAYLGEAMVSIDSSSDWTWWVVGFAAVLLVLLDVGVGTIERRVGQPGAHGPHLLRELTLGTLGLGVGALVLLLAQLPLDRGVLMQAAGIGAVTALLLGLAHLTRQEPR
jgi:hypothetical protein